MTANPALPMHKVLFVTSEAYPLMKTGGLGDVSASLPAALHRLGHDVRVLMPAYAEAVPPAGRLTRVATLDSPYGPVGVLEGTLPNSDTPLWMVYCPVLFDRPGNPYLGPDGRPWHDNADRFALLARVAAMIARGDDGLDWRADIVHCNDWQTALVPALLADTADRPATVFTVHNLAYQGLFSYSTFVALGLPAELWHFSQLEFHGRFAFIKGGLSFADRITTVSPTYAREIQTPEYGCGLDGLLRHRKAVLSGILNGVDTEEWNPAHDPHLAKPYTARRLGDKRANKLALQRELGLPEDPKVPLIGFIGRLVGQKGIDLVLEAMPQLMGLDVQLVLLGSGDPVLEQGLRDWAARHPAKVGVYIGYDEGLAHRIEGGADMFLMPSRFEPCGLNQMYSLRYGTVPIVRRTGGLADAVVDADIEACAAGTANGIVFDAPTVAGLLGGVRRALALYADKRQWRRLQTTGMGEDFSWRRSARAYASLYTELLEEDTPARVSLP